MSDDTAVGDGSGEPLPEFSQAERVAPAIGRPRRYDGRTSTAVRFTPEVHARLQAAAAERDVSMNWIVSRAVEEFLDRLIPVDEMKWTR